ncbi:MAG: hypothetical protein XU15_C0011G0118 [candidate division NC10 bacterium CSP1-5]|nr:MAG: hypothetical protein XU15_C0011G0118 [candidate division NC10 bacterium CSP1-5]
MSDGFRDKLTVLLNENSMENRSDTPDFILAQFLISCLDAFDEAVSRRTEWWGKTPPVGKGDG